MILPVHDVLRARLQAVLTTEFGLSPGDVPPIVIDYPPKRALGDLARRWRSSWRAGCARRRAPSRRRSPPPSDRSRACRASRPRRTATSISFWTGPRFSARGSPDALAAAPSSRRQDHRRAHGHQPEQGGAHRPPPELRARRHARSRAAVPRRPRRGAELHRRHRRPGGRRRRGLPRARAQGARRGARARRRSRASTSTAGISTRASPSGTTRTRRVSRCAPRRCTTSSTAATTTAEIGAFIANAIVRCHLKTMARLNIDYDLLTWEGDILRLKFWARAFEILKQKGAVYLQTEGRLTGCWVMRIDEDAASPEAESAPEDGDAEDREKVIVRSNGTVTYVGKDIAYQFWKFGLLGRDFYYRPFATRDRRRDRCGRRPATQLPRRTASARSAAASRTYNVIDVRQSYLQKLLKQALAAIGHTQRGRAVDPLLVRDGGALAPDRPRARLRAAPRRTRSKPFVEVSGRKGLGREGRRPARPLDRTAAEEVAKRNPRADGRRASRASAEQIAVAAVRYFMVKYLARQGHRVRHRRGAELRGRERSVPPVRGRARQQHLQQAAPSGVSLQRRRRSAQAGDAVTGEATDERGRRRGLWALVLEASRLDEIVEQVVRTLEFSVLAKYAFRSRRRSTASTIAPRS